MTPAGYMAKCVVTRPDWLKAPAVDDISSVSGCVSEEFDGEYILNWKHNGYWLFDSIGLIEEIATAKAIDLADTTVFYYEIFEKEFDEKSKTWSPFEPDSSWPVAVEPPATSQLIGFDVVNYWARTSPECSPLSCNSLAETIPVNRHCLLDSFEQAVEALEAGRFDNSEPGPFRILSVWAVGFPSS